MKNIFFEIWNEMQVVVVIHLRISLLSRFLSLTISWCRYTMDLFAAKEDTPKIYFFSSACKKVLFILYQYRITIFNLEWAGDSLEIGDFNASSIQFSILVGCCKKKLEWTLHVTKIVLQFLSNHAIIHTHFDSATGTGCCMLAVSSHYFWNILIDALHFNQKWNQVHERTMIIGEQTIEERVNNACMDGGVIIIRCKARLGPLLNSFVLYQFRQE